MFTIFLTLVLIATQFATESNAPIVLGEEAGAAAVRLAAKANN